MIQISRTRLTIAAALVAVTTSVAAPALAKKGADDSPRSSTPGSVVSTPGSTPKVSTSTPSVSVPTTVDGRGGDSGKGRGRGRGGRSGRR